MVVAGRDRPVAVLPCAHKSMCFITLVIALAQHRVANVRIHGEFRKETRRGVNAKKTAAIVPRAADFSIGARRQLSEVHRSSYRRSRRRQPLTRTSGRLADGTGAPPPFQRWIVPLLISLKAARRLQIIVRKRVDLGESESSHKPRSPMVVRACIENDGPEDEKCQPKLWPPSGGASASQKMLPRHRYSSLSA